VAFKFTILNFFGLNQNYLYKAFNDKEHMSSPIVPHSTHFKKLNLAPSVVYDNNALDLVYYLSKVTKSLSYMKPQNFLQHATQNNQNRLLIHMYDLLPEATNK
jgi:hypothetical protein